jgi:tetratricopeptide (TPR) repeat protein
MPRFDRLELDSSGRPPDEGKGGPDLVRDEQHWLRQADAERRQGYYENALRYYSRALEMDRSLIAGWLGQVQMLIQLGEYPEADLWARKALELFKNNGELLAGRAQALFRKQDRSQAVASCDAAMGAPGESAYRWLVRGEIMLKAKGDVDRYCFDKATQCDKDWLVSLEIARVYLHHGYPSKALPRIRQAAERAPDQAYVWLTQAVCERELNMPEAARRSLTRCLEILPDHAEATQCQREIGQQGWSLRRALRRLFRRS